MVVVFSYRHAAHGTSFPFSPYSFHISTCHCHVVARMPRAFYFPHHAQCSPCVYGLAFDILLICSDRRWKKNTRLAGGHCWRLWGVTGRLDMRCFHTMSVRSRCLHGGSFPNNLFYILLSIMHSGIPTTLTDATILFFYYGSIFSFSNSPSYLQYTKYDTLSLFPHTFIYYNTPPRTPNTDDLFLDMHLVVYNSDIHIMHWTLLTLFSE